MIPCCSRTNRSESPSEVSTRESIRTQTPTTVPPTPPSVLTRLIRKIQTLRISRMTTSTPDIGQWRREVTPILPTPSTIQGLTPNKSVSPFDDQSFRDPPQRYPHSYSDDDLFRTEPKEDPPEPGPKVIVGSPRERSALLYSLQSFNKSL